MDCDLWFECGQQSGTGCYGKCRETSDVIPRRNLRSVVVRVTACTSLQAGGGSLQTAKASCPPSRGARRGQQQRTATPTTSGCNPDLRRCAHGCRQRLLHLTPDPSPPTGRGEKGNGNGADRLCQLNAHRVFMNVGRRVAIPTYERCCARMSATTTAPHPRPLSPNRERGERQRQRR